MAMRTFAFCFFLILVGCAQQPQMGDNKLIITAFSSDFDTKASETAFDAGDIMGVFLEKNGGINIPFKTTNGSDWAGFDNIGQVAAGDKVTAYYPYNESAANSAAIEVGGGVDFLITSATPITVADNRASVALKFRHVLGKLVVNADVVEINGEKTVSLDSVVAKNVFRKATINLADGVISGLTDKGDLRGKGNEVFVIPQTVQKMEIVFKMENGGFDRLTYNVPIVMNGGEKTTFTAKSNNLYFTSSLNLSNGEAQTGLDLSFFVAAGRTWTLTSSEPWLTIEPNEGVGAATVKVNVEQNAGVPRLATITLTDDKQVTAVQKPMQNYVRTVTIAGIKWTTRNLGAVTPQDYGNFYKWGSTYTYDRSGSNSPSGHWGNATIQAATSPSLPVAGGEGYDYVGLSGCDTPGDPCKSLGRTPTHAQWTALVASGRSAWTTYQGINGYFFGPKATSCNSTTIQPGCIFLPATGYRDSRYGTLRYETTNGLYWSSSVNSSENGWGLSFNSGGGVSHEDGHWRGHGFSVRCVQE